MAEPLRSGRSPPARSGGLISPTADIHVRAGRESAAATSWNLSIKAANKVGARALFEHAKALYAVTTPSGPLGAASLVRLPARGRTTPLIVRITTDLFGGAGLF
jgi:hypothetical protein